MPTSSIASSSKIYKNLDFWFENKPSGNPAGIKSRLQVVTDFHWQATGEGD
jgi:hypothetical protein